MIVQEKKGGQFFNLINGDCLTEMQNIPDNSIDAIVTDPPYGTTACKWDAVINFDLMWEQLHRIIKPNGAIVLFGSEPFSSALRMSNIKNYKYDIIWDKNQSGNPLLAKKQVMKSHEIVSIFYKKQCTYNPQMEERGKPRHKGTKQKLNKNSFLGGGEIDTRSFNNLYYPKSVLKVSNAAKKGKVHPTQKPVELMEWLVKTYTNKLETVLDFTMGSGSTGVACKNTGRSFIGIEKDEKYFNIAVSRIKGTEPNPNNFEKVEAGGLFSFTDEQSKAD
jgi:site-specific DNA-methyltransferase (adenine-specific)